VNNNNNNNNNNKHVIYPAKTRSAEFNYKLSWYVNLVETTFQLFQLFNSYLESVIHLHLQKNNQTKQLLIIINKEHPV